MMINDQRPVIGIIGSGILQQAIQRQLAHTYQLVPLSTAQLAHPAPACDLMIFITDAQLPQDHLTINAFSLRHGIPWLPVYVEFGLGIIGPCVVPGASSCSACAEMRRLSAMQDTAEFVQLRDQLLSGELRSGPSWLTASSADILTACVAQEVESFIRDPQSMHTRNALRHVRLDTLEVSLHRLLPDPRCAACGRLDDDTASAAIIQLQPQPKLGVSTYRVRSLLAEKQPLLERYVDAHTGMVRALVKHDDNIYPNASAFIRLRNNKRDEIGFGRTFNYEVSQLAAVAEAIERYGGTTPGGKRTVIRASYRQLGDQAINPISLGLHSPQQYARPNSPYQPYHDDLVCNWVWGYSFRQQRPILVPERYAYYGLAHTTPHEQPFVYEISNGCALGGCLEEAILYGILEIAERDSFLMTWYAQLSVPRIDLHSIDDPTIGLLVERIENLTGYTLHAFNTTLEQKIPSFWVMGVDERNRPDHAKVLCAAGSHLQADQALLNALLELAPVIQGMNIFYQQNRAYVQQLHTDVAHVTRMRDHALLYCLPETFERFGFLYHTAGRQTFQEAFDPRDAWPHYTDLRDDLHQLLDRYLSTGLDVIVVDQTTAEHAAHQFRCVKVIIPGTLPMTFGHHARRVHGLERLYHLPQQLGYRTERLTAADINPYPHPFP